MSRFMCRVLTCVIPVLGALLCAGFASATDSRALPPFKSELPTVDSYFSEVAKQQRESLSHQMVGLEFASLDIRETRNQGEGDGLRRKSTTRAFIYSLLLPGAGQLYNGSALKALAFFGVEALSWAGHLSWDSNGDDKTILFENFANTHWSQDSYEDYLELNWDTRDDDDISSFTHHLPDTKTQQYYEMIGKYNQFVFGWDDVDPPLSSSPGSEAYHTAYSARRFIYEDMKADAEKEYDRGRAMLYVIMINHVISGFEAALAARSHNRQLDKLAGGVSFKAEMVTIDNERLPMLTMTYKF